MGTALGRVAVSPPLLGLHSSTVIGPALRIQPARASIPSLLADSPASCQATTPPLREPARFRRQGAAAGAAPPAAGESDRPAPCEAPARVALELSGTWMRL